MLTYFVDFLHDIAGELDDHENRLLEQLFVDWVPLVRRDTEKRFTLVPTRKTFETVSLTRKFLHAETSVQKPT